MPHYCFDIVESDNRTVDDIGYELIDDVAAKKQAASLLIELVRDQVRDDTLEAVAVKVRSEAGLPKYCAVLRVDLVTRAIGDAEPD